MKLVGITNCPTGIAHTYMAAEAMQSAADDLGIGIRIETQGSIGVENELTPDEIAEAHAVVIASAVRTDLSRFGGKTVIEWPVDRAIKDPKALISAAAKSTPPDAATSTPGGAVPGERDTSGLNLPPRRGILRHLFTGISYMIPVVAAGGLLIAISFLWGLDQAEGSFGATLNQFGSATLGFMLPVFCAFIAYSIADRPAIAPGLVLGYLCGNTFGIGFLGAIVAGLAVGYLVLGLKRIPMPRAIQGLSTIIFIPIVGVVVVGLLMKYLLVNPIGTLMGSVTEGLANISGVSAVALGAVMGLMTAFDMGGPFDKIAYTFSVGLLAEGITGPMAANMAAGMTPALGLALATLLFRKRFNATEREAGKAAGMLGACFITEGAIPFAAADPLRVLPATMLGAATAGGLSMIFGATLSAPHGGVFAIVIPGVVGNAPLYVLAIVIGSCVTALAVNFTKMIHRAPAAAPLRVAA